MHTRVLLQVNDVTILGAGGEVSDFQHIQTLLDELTTDDYRTDDGLQMTPAEVSTGGPRAGRRIAGTYSLKQALRAPCRCAHTLRVVHHAHPDRSPMPTHLALPSAQVYSYLTRVMYNRRNKFNPLWNTLVVGGMQRVADPDPTSSASSLKPFLGMVSMVGTHYTDSHVATGEGATSGGREARQAQYRRVTMYGKQFVWFVARNSTLPQQTKNKKPMRANAPAAMAAYPDMKLVTPPCLGHHQSVCR